MRRAALLALLAASMVAAACGTASFEIDVATPAPSNTATPTPTLTVPPTPVPTATMIATSATLTGLCQPVIRTRTGKMDVVVANELAMDGGTPVLFHQTQGALGEIDDSGTYEFATVAASATSAGNLVLSFVTPLVYAYRSDAQFRAQVCRVPYFSTLALGAGAFLETIPWDGTRGGILALRADEIVLGSSAQIRAVGVGYRGGISEESSGAEYSGAILSTTTPGVAGEKGEGQDPTKYDGVYGRGPERRGGGGGHRANAGGGGGAGAGAGGAAASGALGGLGGLPSASLGLAVFGGGGGGGQGADSTNAGDGGAGGGFLWVDAGTFTVPNAAFLNATGGSGKSCVATGSVGGGGGGGGGGSLWFHAGVCGGGGIINIEADGGPAGHCTSNAGSFGGGGGGAGRILSATCDAGAIVTMPSTAGGAKGDGGDDMSTADDGQVGSLERTD